jgi:hypothetical protein
LWNEANWWRKRLNRHAGCWFGNRGVRLGDRLDGLGGLLGRLRCSLELLEGFEGAQVHAIGGIDAALNAGEGIERVAERVAEGELCWMEASLKSAWDRFLSRHSIW